MQTANPSRPTRTALLKLNDSNMPMLRLIWKDRTMGASAETPNDYATIQIDANGSGDSKLVVFVNMGASSTSYDQYQFSAHSAAVADPDGVDASPTHTQCTTLKALIKAINALRIDSNLQDTEFGLFASRLHAPADYSLNTDASEIKTMALRLGIPENIKGGMGNGKLELIRLNGYADSNGATDCVMKISYDPDDVDESKEVELAYTRYIPDAAWTELFDFHENPPVLNGPILVEITATTSLAVDAQVLVAYRNAEY